MFLKWTDKRLPASVAAGVGASIISIGELGEDPRIKAIPLSDCKILWMSLLAA